MSLRPCTKVRSFSQASRCLNKPNYSKTLNLPKTELSPKLPLGEARERLLQATSGDLYQWQLRNRNNNSTQGDFIFHDGPPYANGDLHMGHALNKICKDIINRFQLMYNGKRVIYQPGWDCHGLPIELKVETSLKSQSKLEKSPVEIRKACKDWALQQINNQKNQFRQFAIMTDFDTPYITMDHEYEIDQLRVFVKLVELGLLSQQLKPVWWGCETQTALAEAELEYNDNHKSVAVFVKFPLVSDAFKNRYASEIGKRKLQLLIWTSTPWTIPANKAICVNKDLKYTFIHNEHESLMVETHLADGVVKLATGEQQQQSQYVKSNLEFLGSELIDEQYVNPANADNVKHPVLHGDHVVSTAGTGLVHNAPAHGRDDYLVAKENNIPLQESFIDNQGRYVEGSALPPGFAKLAGEKVNEIKTNMHCVDVMKSHDMIYHLNKSFKHSYPYDWRSQTPVIQRATPQWFVNVEKIKPFALEALENVKFMPSGGSNRLKSFIDNRSEWCISRQRCWGVPLPVIYNRQTNEPVMDRNVLEHIVTKIEEFGTDEWFVAEDDISRWIPQELDGEQFYKGQDTMDVWFDSGTSWTTLKDNIAECNRTQQPLADVYLEGSDQHRGWFQSSLLNKVIYSGEEVEGGRHVFKAQAPFKTVITHGFITDGKGQKMSKSRGNVFTPQQAMEGIRKPLTPYLGTDGLRLWVASSNYKQDVSFNPEVLTRVSEMGKKYRLTFKYILGNLHGFDELDKVPYDELSALDKYVLHTLYTLQQTCAENYAEYNFSRVVSSVNTHVNSVLSAFYFDVCKDCLYTDSTTSRRRRAIQTVLSEILKCYIFALAPIQPLLVQEVWSHFRENSSPFTEPAASFKMPDSYANQHVNAQFEKFSQLRDLVFKEMEILKEKGVFKNKLSLEVQLRVEDQDTSELYQFIKQNESYLDDLFLVSQASLSDKTLESDIPLDVGGEKIHLSISPSRNHKCPRCWKFIAEEEDALCKKCDDVVHKTVDCK
ncbi:uncharacterized protein LODBEIA_P08120 [Lodderomyces beijingensis]|uniref:isoleucine--tRNA ligase n=1 Tax=Lodderomyces beijingensis TaxID=1775926 RepID=A0ABP0ZG84_9ASCO